MIDFACQEFDLDEVIKCSLGLTKADYKLMLHFLNSRDDWTTTTELSKKLRLTLSTIQRCVKSLHEKNILDRRQENLDGGGYTFIYKLKNKQELKSRVSDTIHSWVKKFDKELDKW